MPPQLDRKKISDLYMDLIQKFSLRPIRSRKDYMVASALVDRLALLDDKLDSGQADYLATLELLIDAYDEKMRRSRRILVRP